MKSKSSTYSRSSYNASVVPKTKTNHFDDVATQKCDVITTFDRRATLARLQGHTGTAPMFYGGRFFGENQVGLDAKAMERERRIAKGRERKEQVVGCCKKVVAFLFSHVGLAGA